MDNCRAIAICKDMDTEIIIVGGGLNGCTLALALSQQGRAVTLIDALSAEVQGNNRFDGRSYAIAAGSQRMLKALGLWDSLGPDAGPMFDIKVTDGRVGQGPGQAGLHFDHQEIGTAPMGWMVEDRHLRRCLLTAVSEDANIAHLTEARVTAQTPVPGGISVTLEDGRQITGQLLVGSDGRASGTATRAGIQRVKKTYPQTALVCAIAHDRPHNGVAHQFFVPAGPLAILPLQGNRSSIVWTEDAAQAKAINALSDEDYTLALSARIGDFLGDIQLAGDRYTYPLGYILAHKFIGERIALVGDAAHAMHPIAGQGLNVGLRDVAALTHVLAEAHRRGQDPGSVAVLSSYEAWRRSDATTLVAATDTFNSAFSTDNPILRAARGIGMAAVMATPALRRQFIKEAAGLTGTLPDLMRA